MNKIIIHGKGGQGVKLLGRTLAYILTQLDKQVTLTYEYDSNVRGGGITAYLVYDEEKIENPLIEEADYLIVLSPNKELRGKTLVIEESVYDKDSHETAIIIPFTKIAQKLGNLRFVNMVTLGYLLKILGIDIKSLDLKEALPKKLHEENIFALKQGYEYDERSQL